MLITKKRFPVAQILLFGFWPSPIKNFLYRLRGYKIGKGVSIAFGSVLCGEKVSVGAGTSISFFSFVRGRDISIGARVSIGAATMIDTPFIEIGDDTRINEQVFIGGLQFPDSRFSVGKNCQIMQMTFINPAKGISIGDDTGIGGDSLIFGHTSWLSRFEGYPVQFEPIEIGSSVSIAWRVFVCAGAKIGDGAVIGGNSLVNRTIPPRCLATGSPAKVIAKAPHFPSPVSDEKKIDLLRSIVEEMAEFLDGHGVDCRIENQAQLVQVTRRRRRWGLSSVRQMNLWINYSTLESVDWSTVPEPLDVFLSLREIPAHERAQLESRRVLWIDIERKERADLSNDLGEEVAQYLRRYGVRLNRP